jgi:hypothetical protein
MMRKVGNPKLEIPSLFRHHTRTRPPSANHYQAIKVPIAALRDSRRDGPALPAHGPLIALTVRQSSAVSNLGGRRDSPAKAQITPVSTAIHSRVCQCD